MSLISFLVVYETYGKPVVYKVDETFMKSEMTKAGAFEIHMEFDMHEATEEELEEYKKQ
jgi:hypothetical protein